MGYGRLGDESVMQKGKLYSVRARGLRLRMHADEGGEAPPPSQAVGDNVLSEAFGVFSFVCAHTLWQIARHGRVKS